MTDNTIHIENKHFTLTVNPDCTAESLILRESGEECLIDEKLPLFSLTENRPYNNEIKLTHPNKRTTFSANRIRREGNRLIVGFELVTVEAVVEICEAEDYIAFTLTDFIVKPEDFAGLSMTPPPSGKHQRFDLLDVQCRSFQH